MCSSALFIQDWGREKWWRRGEEKLDRRRRFVSFTRI